MMRNRNCSEYGPSTLSPRGMFEDLRTTERFTPTGDTTSTNIYWGSDQIPVRRIPQILRIVSLGMGLEPIKVVSDSDSFYEEDFSFGVYERSDTIHLDPIKKFKVKARVMSRKQGTIKNIDKNTIIP